MGRWVISSDGHDYEPNTADDELFKQMCEEDEIKYDENRKQHEYQECEAEYLNGTWCC